MITLGRYRSPVSWPSWAHRTDVTVHRKLCLCPHLQLLLHSREPRLLSRWDLLELIFTFYFFYVLILVFFREENWTMTLRRWRKPAHCFVLLEASGLQLLLGLFFGHCRIFVSPGTGAKIKTTEYSVVWRTPTQSYKGLDKPLCWIPCVWKKVIFSLKVLALLGSSVTSPLLKCVQGKPQKSVWDMDVTTWLGDLEVLGTRERVSGWCFALNSYSKE